MCHLQTDNRNLNSHKLFLTSFVVTCFPSSTFKGMVIDEVNTLENSVSLNPPGKDLSLVREGS